MVLDSCSVVANNGSAVLVLGGHAQISHCNLSAKYSGICAVADPSADPCPFYSQWDVLRGVVQAKVLPKQQARRISLTGHFDSVLHAPAPTATRLRAMDNAFATVGTWPIQLELPDTAGPSVEAARQVAHASTLVHGQNSAPLGSFVFWNYTGR